MGECLQALKDRMAKLSDLRHLSSLGHWDQQTMMPPRGAAARADSLATLERMCHELLIDAATGRLLEENKSPSRKVGEIDNRGSHFYLALYWARELAHQADDPELAERFAVLAERLAAEEETIVSELTEVQGSPVELGGYYRPDPDKASAAMRPSATFNDAVESLSAATSAPTEAG